LPTIDSSTEKEVSQIMSDTIKPEVIWPYPRNPKQPICKEAEKSNLLITLLIKQKQTHGSRKKSAKWVKRIAGLKKALANVEAAIKAVNEWTPGQKSAFIEEQVKLAVDSFHQELETPVSYDQEMIQLAASDKKIRRRLFQWLNLLKASFIGALDRAQSSAKWVADSNAEMNKFLSQIIKLENADLVRLGNLIKNWTMLLKNYGENEKIYTALQVQTQNVLKANKEWCKVENANYGKSKSNMEDQLKVFVELKLWLRKNYSRVKQWIRKRYNR